MEKIFYTEQILENTLHPYLQRTFRDGLRFVQDNDSKHTSLHARSFMTQNVINWWKWPAGKHDYTLQGTI
ncbi:hypothetical protein CI610_03134 [invertebrate metagenome]|uniref:Uncharacterized protein n=1 Tax=invertebrate metagenome TaxID=1711999 RepID=A0A2H9T3X2_9ZZZZ